jgi:mannitol 2-dehydrogenase
MSTRLDNAALGSLLKNVAVPTYGRSGLMPGIVHLGVGGFHRAHQAMYLDRLLSNGAATRDWAIRGVGVLEADRAMKEALAAQDYLYTLSREAP